MALDRNWNFDCNSGRPVEFEPLRRTSLRSSDYKALLTRLWQTWIPISQGRFLLVVVFYIIAICTSIYLFIHLYLYKSVYYILCADWLSRKIYASLSFPLRTLTSHRMPECAFQHNFSRSYRIGITDKIHRRQIGPLVSRRDFIEYSSRVTCVTTKQGACN